MFIALFISLICFAVSVVLFDGFAVIVATATFSLPLLILLQIIYLTTFHQYVKARFIPNRNGGTITYANRKLHLDEYEEILLSTCPSMFLPAFMGYMPFTRVEIGNTMVIVLLYSIVSIIGSFITSYYWFMFLSIPSILIDTCTHIPNCLESSNPQENKRRVIQKTKKNLILFRQNISLAEERFVIDAYHSLLSKIEYSVNNSQSNFERQLDAQYKKALNTDLCEHAELNGCDSCNRCGKLTSKTPKKFDNF